jgi:hypothetical protein
MENQVHPLIREAAFGVLHLFERGDIVERCAQLDTLLSTYSTQAPAGASQFLFSAAVADGERGEGQGQGESSASSEAATLSYASLASFDKSRPPTLTSAQVRSAEEMKHHIFSSLQQASEALLKHLDCFQHPHPGIRRQVSTGSSVAFYKCAGKDPCALQVRFRKRQLRIDSVASEWKVALDRGKGDYMQWLHCPKCTETAVPSQIKISAKDILQDSKAQQLVTENPCITAKKLGDLLKSNPTDADKVCCQLVVMMMCLWTTT